MKNNNDVFESLEMNHRDTKLNPASRQTVSFTLRLSLLLNTASQETDKE